MSTFNESNCVELIAKTLEIQVKCLNEQIAMLRSYVPSSSSTTTTVPSTSVQETGKKKKKVLDPNRPKRSRSAYQMFIMDALPKLKEAHPELTQRDIMALGAKQWKSCPPKRKEELERIATKEKAEYTIVKAQYEASLKSGDGGVSPTDMTSASTENETTPKPKSSKKKKDATPIATVDETPVTPAVHILVEKEEKKKKKDKKNKRDAASSGEESSKKKKKTK